MARKLTPLIVGCDPLAETVSHFVWSRTGEVIRHQVNIRHEPTHYPVFTAQAFYLSTLCSQIIQRDSLADYKLFRRAVVSCKAFSQNSTTPPDIPVSGKQCTLKCKEYAPFF
jgi:hypothetical protein